MARDHGSIEVYQYEHKSPVALLLFETKVTESITGIDVGFVSSSAAKEVILSTYSGKIMALTTRSTIPRTQTVVE